jgi:cysteine sulfinate desulfinase/cysteine desulfurase-like protein
MIYLDYNATTPVAPSTVLIKNKVRAFLGLPE